MHRGAQGRLKLKDFQHIGGHARTWLLDSHAGNRGSKPLRGANKIIRLTNLYSDSFNFFWRASFNFSSAGRSARSFCRPRFLASSASRTVAARLGRSIDLPPPKRTLSKSSATLQDEQRQHRLRQWRLLQTSGADDVSPASLRELGMYAASGKTTSTRPGLTVGEGVNLLSNVLGLMISCSMTRAQASSSPPTIGRWGSSCVHAKLGPRRCRRANPAFGGWIG